MKAILVILLVLATTASALPAYCQDSSTPARFIMGKNYWRVDPDHGARWRAPAHTVQPGQVSAALRPPLDPAMLAKAPSGPVASAPVSTTSFGHPRLPISTLTPGVPAAMPALSTTAPPHLAAVPPISPANTTLAPAIAPPSRALPNTSPRIARAVHAHLAPPATHPLPAIATYPNSAGYSPAAPFLTKPCTRLTLAGKLLRSASHDSHN